MLNAPWNICSATQEILQGRAEEVVAAAAAAAVAGVAAASLQLEREMGKMGDTGTLLHLVPEYLETLYCNSTGMSYRGTGMYYAHGGIEDVLI